MQGPRVLTQSEATALLAGGVTLQQWIGVLERDGFRFIRWVEVNASEDGFSVYEHESLDDGPANRDLTSFYNDLDPDCPEGVLYRSDSVDAAIDACVRLGCRPDGFVRFCEIQALYDAFVAEHDPPKRSGHEYFLPG